jgi:LmbE family N-acetylglucosaminyl deacetylase
MKLLNYLFFALFSLSLLPAQAQPLDYEPRILLVTAHPDDDAIFAGTIFKTTRMLNGKVDLALMTNGEGGYKYSVLGRYIYNKELDREEVGREYLPAIRKKELMAGGDIMGLRNYFFFDQEDFYYTLDINETLEKWDTDDITKKLAGIIQQGDYDFMFLMLPHPDTHGHHKASAILAMRAAEMLPVEERPIAFVSFVRSPGREGTQFTMLEGFPLSEVDKEIEVFEFDRNQKFGFDDRLDYNIIADWVIAEHKSQGTMQLLAGGERIEQYHYLKMNEGRGIDKARAFFEAVTKVRPE